MGRGLQTQLFMFQPPELPPLSIPPPSMYVFFLLLYMTVKALSHIYEQGKRNSFSDDTFLYNEALSTIVITVNLMLTVKNAITTG